MKKTEKEIIKEITKLFSDLDAATYGKDKPNGGTIKPNAYGFYLCTKQLFKLTDELFAEYQPDYISNNDYYYICDCERIIMLELEVLKTKKSLNGQSLTKALEPYLIKLQGLYEVINVRTETSLIR